MSNPIKVYIGSEHKADLLQTDIFNVSVEERQNDESTLQFDIDISNEKYKYVMQQNALFETDNKAYIHILSDDSGEEKHVSDNSKIAHVNLVERHYELAKKYVTAYNSTTGYSAINTNMVVVLSGGTSPLIVNGTTITTSYTKGSAGYALTAILYGSGWSVGTVDVTGEFDLETDKQSVIDNIKEIIKLWGGILVIDSKAKKISLRSEEAFAIDNGFEVSIGHNAKQISKQISRDIITKAFIYGKDNLNIKSVNSNLEYIENHTYIADVYEGILSNPDIAIASQLKEWGTKQLAKQAKVRSKISAEFTDKSLFDNTSSFKTNDIVSVFDSELDVNYKARVLYKKYDYFAPYNCSAEFGDNLNDYDDILNNVIKTTKVVNNLIATNQKISSSSILTPDKSDVTTVLINNQSAINQNSSAIELLQETQITENQVETIISESVTLADGEINLFVKEQSALKSTTYAAPPSTHLKNDTLCPDKNYNATSGAVYEKGKNYIATSENAAPTYKNLVFSDGKTLQFSDGYYLVFADMNANNWDKKDKYQTDKDVSASFDVKAEAIRMDFQNGGLSSKVQFDADGIHCLGNGVEVKDNSGNKVFGVDTNGNLGMRGYLGDMVSTVTSKTGRFNAKNWNGETIVVDGLGLYSNGVLFGGIYNLNGYILFQSEGASCTVTCDSGGLTFANEGMYFKAENYGHFYNGMDGIEMVSEKYNSGLIIDGLMGNVRLYLNNVDVLRATSTNLYTDCTNAYFKNLYTFTTKVTSDRELKKDIVQNKSYALDKLKNVNFYGYTINKPVVDKDLKETGEFDNSYSTKIGLMHDECPDDIATTEENGEKHIDLYASISLALKGIQELNKKVDRQAVRISDLESENLELRKLLEREKLERKIVTKNLKKELI